MKKVKRATNSVYTHVAISPQLLNYLRQRAKDEARSVSSLMRFILEQEFKTRPK